MNALNRGFHPSFDALSALADRGDVEVAQTRVARHVASCPQCREIVDEIRAMGDAARDVELPGAPDGLWSRIAKQVADERTRSVHASQAERVVDVPIGRDVGGDESAALHATGATDRDRQRRTTLGIIAVLVVGTSAVVTSSLRSLGAATPARLSLSKEYVAPGDSVVARYRPIAALADLPALTVWARYESTVGAQEFDQRLVRAGTLRRVSPQEYVGAVTVPAGSMLGFFAVGDSSGRVMDRASGRPHFLATLLAADETRRPPLEAYVALLDTYRNRLEDADAARAADAMERQYRDHPETWLVTNSVTHRGLVSDFVKRFESLERAYAGWNTRLAKVPSLSVFVEKRMVDVGDYVMDTAATEFWTKRLIAEHPGDPVAIELWLKQYSQVRPDSVAAALAAIERKREAVGGGTPGLDWRGLQLALQRGDPALIRTWRLRLPPGSPMWMIDWERAGWLRDTTNLADVDSMLHRALVTARRDSGAVPMVWLSPARTARFSAARIAAIRTRLAAVQLLRGETQSGKDSLDAIINDLAPGCPMPETARWRADAELKMGQADAARDDLAYLATMENWRVALVGDSVPQLLGSHYSPQSWTAAKQAAKERWRSCEAAARQPR